MGTIAVIHSEGKVPKRYKLVPSFVLLSVPKGVPIQYPDAYSTTYQIRYQHEVQLDCNRRLQQRRNALERPTIQVIFELYDRACTSTREAARI
jgi:hypothetical protein